MPAGQISGENMTVSSFHKSWVAAHTETYTAGGLALVQGHALFFLFGDAPEVARSMQKGEHVDM
jgi:hypothetical protein